MNQHDAEVIVSIAAMAAMADGYQDEHELAQIVAAGERLGLMHASATIETAKGQASITQLADALSDAAAKQVAYDVAIAVCNAGGPANAKETDFLNALAWALQIDPAPTNTAVTAALTDASALAPPPHPAAPPATVMTSAPASTNVTGGETNASGTDALDQHILDQAMLTAALELLPDRLANIAILPLQMRLFRYIGQQAGQQADANQFKDLAAVLGLGAAAQLMESVIRKAFGGIAGSLLGGMLGGSAGVAAGGAVTFASTYALGHAARQYYAQGRTLSTADLKALLARFQGEAKTIYPTVQNRIATLAKGTNLGSILKSVTG